MTLLSFEVFSTKHLFHSFAGRSKTVFLNASTASSCDWNL
ncbi:unnamed protein product [Acanthoscelides obtectus]|uniref:Uncharacterized protein n=1 Tax=Acanthoscelides obtectus TaxID=200917 RepID=A0A9P0LN81_ACAOB|nr:unnamed protein product [Acanthoscelides obtectus]CAH1995759.1 unnamed protein product [Acanthoscelides obtectus]CAK1626571.1 hypothetical protein AOBTE_LOCUS3941 [Acanthoscelides obtectus]CAK1626572.1 hypothetical protein AOBTE_LOCUS3942 [Acanthoscelides obtectus]